MPSDVLTAVYRKDLVAITGFSARLINAKDGDGRTPLMHAVLAEDASVDVVALLISRGALVDAHDAARHWTALHYAARDQKTELVDALLGAGTSVDALDLFGNTPLCLCVGGARPDLGALKALIRGGANPDRKNRDGIGPRDLAVRARRADILKVFDQPR